MSRFRDAYGRFARMVATRAQTAAAPAQLALADLVLSSRPDKAARQAASRALREARLLAPPPTPKVTFGENYYTNQIYSRGFEFAMLSPQADGYHQACTFVHCKDFFHDLVWATVNDKPWAVYSLVFDPKNGKGKRVDLENSSWVMRNTAFSSRKPEFHGKRLACQEFLNGIEEKLGFDPTQIHEVEHIAGPCWLIIGDKGWQHAPPLLGLYTLFIRLGFMHTPGETVDETLTKAREGKIKIGEDGAYAGYRDCGYISQAWETIQKIFECDLTIFHPEMKDNYPVAIGSNAYELHNYYGPVAFQTAIRDPKAIAHKGMPFWFRPEIWGSK